MRRTLFYLPLLFFYTLAHLLKEKWQSPTLRRTTLNASETVSGRVYFPRP
ncbi:MAG: hypothetical protein ALAOOOJD_01895 [bacterium]|nr:hypothetical protein [bacterium]